MVRVRPPVLSAGDPTFIAGRRIGSTDGVFVLGGSIRVRKVPAGQQSFAPTDLAVPVIDDVPLFERLGDRYPGMDLALVAPPSPHWLGEPVYQEESRAVILDGGCGIADCCGVMARITLDGPVVAWSDFFARDRPPLPDGLHFEFDRGRYEAAIGAVLTSEPMDLVFGYDDGTKS